MTNQSTPTRTQGKYLGVSRAVRPVVAVWILLTVAGGAAALVWSRVWFLGLAIVLLATAAATSAVIRLMIARGRVLRESEVSLMRGWMKFVSWNPTEGVIFLKNKQIDVVDDNVHDGGGIRVLYPLLGEELVLRVPLEVQTLRFEDNEVITKEYMPLTVKGTVYWKVKDLHRFYLYISKELHSSSDTGRHLVEASSRRPQLEVAEQWLRLMAEEKTRAIVSRVGTGLLIADQLAADLPKGILPASTVAAPESSKSFRSAADRLADDIKADFSSSIQPFGLEIHKVALQEIKLPPDIYAAAVETCRSAYLPLRTHAEAIQKRLMLQAEADVIGKDAAGMKAIASSLPNIPALTFQEFLAPLFLDLYRKRTGDIRGLPMAADPGVVTPA